jgi:hypothetical protein
VDSQLKVGIVGDLLKGLLMEWCLAELERCFYQGYAQFGSVVKNVVNNLWVVHPLGDLIW